MMNQTVTFLGPGEVEMVESDIPRPQPGQVLVKTTRSLISTGTELTILSGEFPKESAWAGYGQYPFKAGYSSVGEVVEVGDGVDEAWLGRRVISIHHSAYCVMPADKLIGLPDNVPDEQAAFHALAKIVMNGVRRSRVNWGEAVVIYGLGLLGQLTARFCALNRARPVIGVDVSPQRLAMLPERPYMHGMDARTEDIKAATEALTDGRMADIVFEVTGNQELINGEFDVLKTMGRFILLSSPRGATNFDFHDHCNFYSYEIIGAHVCCHPAHETPYNPWTAPRNIELFFKHIAWGDLDIGSLITHREQAADAPAVYRRLLENRSDAMGVILEWC